MILSERLLSLTTEQFVQLQQSGVLYSLYPELEGQLINMQQFELFKEDYNQKREVEMALYNVLQAFYDLGEIDPQDIWELIQEHKEDIMKMFNREDVDIDTIIDNVRGDCYE